jgi:hypothetical protein
MCLAEPHRFEGEATTDPPDEIDKTHDAKDFEELGM